MQEERQVGDPDGFVLFRILGNDLPPRHEAGQTAANLRFVLDQEPPLAGCLKIWLLNRIVDPALEAELTDLLDRHGARYHRIPFEAEAYGRVGWDFESFSPTGYLYGQEWEALADPQRARVHEKTYAFKNLYVMNNNGARNHALVLGRSLARWVLPFDGNCFFTASGWDRLRADVRARAHLPYFVVPMTRVLDNSALLDPDFKAEPSQEPQILFRRDARETFDERYRYGTRPKVALLMRLGVPGVWDRLAIDPWEPPRPAPSPDAGRFAEAGWVARLSSGHPEQEEATPDATRRRNLARRGGILAMLDGLDERLLRGTFDADRLLSMPEERLAAAATGAAGGDARAHLIVAADAALGRGPYSVVQKTQVLPSGDPHDYWHPAPHWWPNPATADGLPPIHRDGERLPGTRIGEPGSEQYDRDRLQALFDETWTLALAWRLTGRAAYADHAARLVRTWFLDPDTRMNPHLTYAQVRFGDDAGDGTGLIEFKDISFFLDAVRLLRRSGAFRDRDQEGFRSWLGDYAGWLDGSRQGTHARTRPNNLGTYYDLQRLAVAAYLDDARGVIDTLKASRYRLTRQFDRDGAQPLEARRANPEHYGLFNLEGWFALATLAGGCGIDLWTFEDRHGGVLRRAFGWLARHHAEPEPPPGRTPVDPGRYAPLWYGARRHLAWDEPMPARVEAGIRHAFSGSGCLPYWTLAWERDAPTGP